MNIVTMTSPGDFELTHRDEAQSHQNDPDDLNYRGPKWWVTLFNFDLHKYVIQCKTFEISWRYLVKQWPITSQTLALLGIAIITWTLAFILMPKYVSFTSAPTRMAILFIGGQAFGVLLRLIQWPEMLGMIGFGMIFANLGYTNFTGYTELEAFFRCVPF